jgi:hypothetical protein
VLLTALAMVAACEGRSPNPTAPSTPRSFLAGTWSGTLSIEREGEPTTSGSTTWRFEVVEGTNLQTFQVTIRCEHAWLPITTTVTSAITPSNTPPARISTQGEYPSPRGCTGSFLSVGTADTTRMDADLTGIDCLTLAHSTFRGRVLLTTTAS